MRGEDGVISNIMKYSSIHLSLKMVAHTWKYREICKNSIPMMSNACTASIMLAISMSGQSYYVASLQSHGKALNNNICVGKFVVTITVQHH